MPLSTREVAKAMGIKTATQARIKQKNRVRLDRALAAAESDHGPDDGKHPVLRRKRTPESKAHAAGKALKEYDDAEKKRLVVAHYTKHGVLGGAAKSVGVLRSTVERWIIDDPVFREQMIDAHETVIDDLESRAIKRAKGYKDKSSGEYIPGSDDLLKFMLRANRPGKFAANGSAFSGGAGAGGSVADQRRHEEEQLQKAQRQKFKIAGQEIEF